MTTLPATKPDRPTCPKWIREREGVTNRQWKARKRRELKAVIRAMDVYRMGCAYCPGKSGEVVAIDSALRGLKHLHSVKMWGS